MNYCSLTKGNGAVDGNIIHCILLKRKNQRREKRIQGFYKVQKNSYMKNYSLAWYYHIFKIIIIVINNSILEHIQFRLTLNSLWSLADLKLLAILLLNLCSVRLQICSTTLESSSPLYFCLSFFLFFYFLLVYVLYCIMIASLIGSWHIYIIHFDFFLYTCPPFLKQQSNITLSDTTEQCLFYYCYGN